MVLLYMVCHGSHQYTPVMLAYIYQHHGSVMGNLDLELENFRYIFSRKASCFSGFTFCRSFPFASIHFHSPCWSPKPNRHVAKEFIHDSPLGFWWWKNVTLIGVGSPLGSLPHTNTLAVWKLPWRDSSCNDSSRQRWSCCWNCCRKTLTKGPSDWRFRHGTGFWWVF